MGWARSCPPATSHLTLLPPLAEASEARRGHDLEVANFAKGPLSISHILKGVEDFFDRNDLAVLLVHRPPHNPVRLRPPGKVPLVSLAELPFWDWGFAKMSISTSALVEEKCDVRPTRAPRTQTGVEDADMLAD